MVGDSLFACGCGRLFEGTAEQLVAVMQTYRQADPRSLVCCAHEYTQVNLKFAASVLPDVVAIQQRITGFDAERDGSGSSVPDTLEREWQTNPFLLALDASVRTPLASQLGVGDDETEVIRALRGVRDRF